MVVPDFDSITAETYHQQFAADSILSIDVDEMRVQKLLTKQDMSALKRLIVKFRFHLKEGNENVENYKKGDILLDHAVFISDLMIKRTSDLQAAAKLEKDKNHRSENFMVTVSLFKKGLVAFENQQAQLRRHLARLAYGNTEEGAAYFKQQAREELTVIVKERLEEYKRKEEEMKAQESAKKEAEKEAAKPNEAAKPKAVKEKQD
uniref:TOP4c domain-containing protein n=1 Tax=Caenorhabditis tropicalis TaxID=1561998 RepID=A0A1I7URY7_9PELO